jgi:DNA-binding response OmpR family regulator
MADFLPGVPHGGEFVFIQLTIPVPGAEPMVKWSSNWRPGRDCLSPAAQFLSVLVVGHPSLADSCCQALTTAGIDSRAAYSGLSGLLTAEKRRPDVLLIDLSLPDLDGIDLAKAIRSSDDLHEMLLIALYDDENDHPEYRESLGVTFDRYLVEPINLPQLAEIVRATWRSTREGPFGTRKCDPSKPRVG